MKQKNRIVRILIGEVLLLLFVVASMTVIKMIPSQKSEENNLQSQTLFRKIFEKDNFITTFKASENKLKRLDVLFKNPNLESRDEIEIILLEDKKELFRNSYNGYNFGDTSHARIDFPAITDSKNTEYTLVVREVKNVDGKLELGVKNDEINFIQYYGENPTLLEAFRASISSIFDIFETQTIVLGLPMLFWGAFLW